MPSTRRPERDLAWRRRLRADPRTRAAYRAVVALVGLVLVVGGLLLVPLPGPGWLIVLGGVGVWATEFHWARRLETWGRRRLHEWASWVAGRSAWVRALLGGAVAACVAVAGLATLWWAGTPSWLPDAVEGPVDDLVATYLPAR